MELRQYIKILRKHIWMILGVCLIGGVSSFYYSLQQPPVYRAITTLALNPSASNVYFQMSAAATAQDLFPTYIAYLKTRAFASLVVKELNLADVSEDTLLSAISAEGVQNTLFFRISAVSNRREYAPLIANTVASVFIEQNIKQQQEQRRQQANQQGNLKDPEMQRLEQFRSELEDQNKYYTALIESTRRQLDDLEKLPASNERDKRVLDLRAQLQQAQDLNLKALTSLADVQAKTAQLSAGNVFNTAVVVDEARVPNAPEASRTPINVLLALAASLALSVGGAILLEYLDYTYKNPEELDAEYGMPTLATIYAIEGKGKKEQDKLVALYYPKSSVTESYRALRTNIQFAIASKPIKTLLVTSAHPNEGKTVTAANLAIVFAQMGQRVILCDLDLRRPSVHRFFAIPNRLGFTNLLLDNPLSLDSYLQPTPVDGLMVLTSGPLPPSPAEVLSSPKTRLLLERLCAEVDLLIVDSPPAALVTDAAILASQLDAVIQVVLAGVTRRDVVKRGRDVLARSGGRLLGPVINRMKTSESTYKYQYYGYEDQSTIEKEANPLWNRAQPARNGNGTKNGRAAPQEDIGLHEKRE